MISTRLSEKQLLEFAQDFVELLPINSVIYLEGQLGAGKTTFVRCLLRALGYKDKVKSPSYTLVESYELERRTIHHFDFYRLQDPAEIVNLGWSDYLTPHSTLLIEWPDQAKGYLPEPTLSCKIYPIDAAIREFCFYSPVTELQLSMENLVKKWGC